MIIKGIWYILGNGIKFDDEYIEILPYLKLQKVNKLSVFELAGLGAKGFQQWSLIEPFCYLENNFEIISLENDRTFGYDILNRAWLLNTLLVLRKKTRVNSIALLNSSWNNLKDLNKVEANLCDYHINMIRINDEEIVVNKEDINWIRDNFENANLLAFENEKFKYALEVLNAWRYCIDIKSAIAIIWASIESIVNVNAEISYRLSLSISSLLKERGAERIDKFKNIRKLYQLRSDVIHGNKIKEENINKALIESFNLLCELVIYMIENKKMLTEKDFEESIFN